MNDVTIINHLLIGIIMFDRNEGMQGKEQLLKRLESNHPQTTIAVFDLFPMYPDDISRLIEIIKSNTNMLELSLLNCNLTATDTKLIAEALLENNTLELVNIEKCMDDLPEIKQLLDKVVSHLETNVANQNKSSPTT